MHAQDRACIGFTGRLAEVHSVPLTFLDACPSPTARLNMKKWETEHSEGVTLDKQVGGCSFLFPDAPGHINYLTSKISPAKVGDYLSPHFEVEIVSGRPEFVSLDNTRGLPPNVHVMFETRDDDMVNQFGRYWSKSLFILGAIKNYAMVCNFNPDLWTDVYGKSGSENRSQFEKAIKNIGRVGLTFGGGNSFGHGLYVKNGKVRFTLRKFKLR